MKKIFLILSASMILLSCSACGNKDDAYYEQAWKAYSLMIRGGIVSEGLVAEVHDTWHSAIFDDDSIYKEEYGLDFNDAINDLYSYDTVVDWCAEIEEYYDACSSYMSDLDNPSDNTAELNENLDELFDVFYDLKEMALSPSGSLTSYTEAYNELSPNLSKYIDYVSLEFPEDFDPDSIKYSEDEEHLFVD